MSEGATTARPDLLPELGDDLTGYGSEWIVIVWNNDHNTWDEVVAILMQATGCTQDEAEMETWEVDQLGKSLVHHADRPECERVASIIRTIGIRVTVEKL